MNTGFSMSLPKGGRGKQAPYKTIQVRCPEPVKPIVQEIIRQFHEQGTVNLNTGITKTQEANEGITKSDVGLKSSEVADLKEEIRRLQAVVRLEKQQKEMCQHKLDKAQQSNKELGNLVCEARAEIERLQSATNSPDSATLFNQLRPLLNRLSDRDRRAIQQKLEEIVD